MNDLVSNRPRTNNRPNNLIIEDARIIFRNFEGKEKQFNAEGDRNFTLVLEDQNIVDALERDGWNVKYLKPREEGDSPQAILKVKVNFKGRPPRIVFVTSRGKTNIPEEDAYMVDFADIRKVDINVSPYSYTVNGNTGISAYLQSIYMVLNEDELDLKYADVPELQKGVSRLAIESGDDSVDDIGEMDVIEGELIGEEEAPF